MPASRLTDVQTTVLPFDVTAQLGDAARNLYVHALICIEPDVRNDVTNTTVLKQFHMGPPLGPKRLHADAAGTAELTPDQCRQIKTFLDERKLERAAEKKRLSLLGNKRDTWSQYCVIPESLPPTPSFSLWRFSCVGLVLQAYREAGIELIREPYPITTLEEVKEYYPTLAHYLDEPAMRARVGLVDGSEWRVALVGYLLHSLARPASEINGPDSSPYQPKKQDAYFGSAH